MLEISNNVTLADWEIELNAFVLKIMVNGGQRVNNFYLNRAHYLQIEPLRC